MTERQQLDMGGDGELYIWLDFADMKDFADTYMLDIEHSIEAEIFDTYVAVPVKHFMGGHGFSMNELFKYLQPIVDK